MIPAALTLDRAALALAEGRTSSVDLVEASLDSIAKDGSAYVRVNAEAARAAAAASDRRRRAGRPLSPVDGAPVSLKDLFDVAGETTPAGSAILRSAPPAAVDAPTTARLKAAGCVIIGRTHMSEVAFTGLGLNPHAPLLANPRDPSRVPGGSSSGAAVSVARGQALAGVGTDTGGSVRIPAAFCGLVGFKPTQSRISRQGVFPLSPSLDSVGPIAGSSAGCRLIDAVLSDEPLPVVLVEDLGGVVVGAPANYVLDGADAPIAEAYDAALRRLEAAGARIERFRFPACDEIAAVLSRGAIANAEAYAFHRRCGYLAAADAFDPEVLARILVGRSMSAADYIDLLEARIDIRRRADLQTEAFDVVAVPTTPTVAPRLAEVAEPASFQRLNALALRNPSLVNFLDRCAVSLPMAVDGPAPGGLMLIGPAHSDARTLALAAAVEAVIG